MFGSNDNQNNQAQDQNNFGGQPASPSNDFGTMPPIESTPFGTSTAPATDDATTAPAPAPASDTPTPATTPGSDDLLGIKQDALQQLTPLVDHLEQTPEEKFRTTMMMIQAADDQNLVKVAFEAAKQITDDKARAQALLDVINEINYFTQHNQN